MDQLHGIGSTLGQMIYTIRDLLPSAFNDYLCLRLQKTAEWRMSLDHYYHEGADQQQHSDTGFVYYTYANDRDWNMINSQDINRGYFNNLAETILHTALANTGLENAQIHRIMWNYYNRSSQGVMHQDHRDPEMYSMVYNLSDSDGGTEIKGVFHKGSSGTAIVFPSELEHRGFGPTKDPRRFVLNCIFSAQITDK